MKRAIGWCGGALAGVMLFCGQAAAETGPGKLLFCSDMAFTKCSTTLTAEDQIFVRASFDKPVAVVFKELFGLDSVPSSGKFAFAVAKNADDDKPILAQGSMLFVSRYTKSKTIDLTLQADDKVIESFERPTAEMEKMDPNSITTMAGKGLPGEWARVVAGFKEGTTNWEAFFFFVPSNGDPKMGASAKFTYSMTGAGRKKLAAGMNDYDKERFEILPDDGVTTSVHKANVGKVVFAKTKMVKGHDNAKDLLTSASNLMGGLYARMYLKQSMRNAMAELGGGKDVGDMEYETVISVDNGKLKRKVPQNLSRDEALKLTSWSLTLVPANDADAKDMPEFTKKVVYLISTLAPGKHTLSVESFAQVGDQRVSVSSGTIDLNITAADRDAVAKKWGYQMAGRGLFAQDKTLEAQLRAAIGLKPLAFGTPVAWELRKNGAGVVTHRVTQIEYAVQENGECQRHSEMMQQDKKGAGFGAASRSSEKAWQGVERDIPCQNAK